MVHQYQLNGYNIVLDTCSGSVHVVDEVAYDVIAMYPEHTADEIVAAMLAKYGSRPDVTEEDLRQCIDDVTSLKENGKLWSPDVYKDMAFDFKNRNTVVKALCLHVAHSCNLSCSYCFASQGRYHGDRALMSFEVGKRAMDFLIENSGTRRNLEVDFFGGEPLMNFDMVKKLVAYCREQEKIHNKNFRFTMTTNGMLIDDDVIDFCNKECHNVVLSLDGRKEVHGPLAHLEAHQGAVALIAALRGEAVGAVEVAGVCDVEAEGLHHRLAVLKVEGHVLVDVGRPQLACGLQRGHILEALAQVGFGDVGAGAVLGQQSGHDLVGRVLFVHRNDVVSHVVHDMDRAAAAVQHDVISVQLILVYHFILQSIVAIKKCRPAKAA